MDREPHNPTDGMLRNNSADALALKDWTDELKYLNRLDMMEFQKWFFPDATAEYFAGKWRLFNRDKLGFIWSCSMDKLERVIEYIRWCKNVD